jgi:hypothetical protein
MSVLKINKYSEQIRELESVLTSMNYLPNELARKELELYEKHDFALTDKDLLSFAKEYLNELRSYYYNTTGVDYKR